MSKGKIGKFMKEVRIEGAGTTASELMSGRLKIGKHTLNVRKEKNENK